MAFDVKFCPAPKINLSAVGEYFQKSINAGQMSNFGTLYQEFSQRLHAYLNVNQNKEVVLTSSGHTALMAAYRTLGVRRLLVPCYTFESTRVAATQQGIQVRVVDCDPETGALSLDALRKIPEDTYDGIVVVTPLSAIPFLDRYAQFCAKRKKKLIIDGAASFGTPGIFNYGDAYCLSFHATKTLPVGEAGAVIINNKQAQDVKRYINFGLKDGIPNLTGINGKVSELTCAVGLHLLDTIEPELQARRANVQYIKKALANAPVMFLFSTTRAETVYQSLSLYTDNAERVRADLKDIGIQTLKYYRPLIEDSEHFRSSVGLFEKSVCLPIHSGLTEEAREAMIKVIFNHA